MIKVNGLDFPWAEDLSVNKLLKEKNYTFPSIVVKINDQVIDPEDFEITFIANGDDVKVIHLITGG
jgi:sulfur carrier protein